MAECARTGQSGDVTLGASSPSRCSAMAAQRDAPTPSPTCGAAGAGIGWPLFMTWRMSAWCCYSARPAGAGDLFLDEGDPDRVVTFLPWIYELTDPGKTYQRCPCGTWLVDIPATRQEYVRGSRSIPASYLEPLSGQ